MLTRSTSVLQVSFCSESCRAKGLKEHAKECKIFGVLASFTIDVRTWVQLKCIINTTFSELREKERLLEKECHKTLLRDVSEGKAKFSSADYSAIYHTTCTKETKENILHSCLEAFLITKILYQSEDFFITREGLPFSPNEEDMVLTGSALLRYMLYMNRVFSLQGTQV